MSAPRTGGDGVDLAIVGAGFSGRMLAAQLVQQGVLPARTVLLDPQLDGAPGRAWTDPAGLWSANVPAGNLSAWPDDPAHFLRWWAALRGVSETDLSGAFAPRALYGRYLAGQLQQALSQVPAGRELQLRPQAVRDLRMDGGGWRLQLDDGAALQARQVVLACGFGAGGLAAPGLRNCGDALDPQLMAGLSPAARIMLVGSGLTAVDALQQLAMADHRGPLLLLSRHDLLPSAHAEVAAPRRAWAREELGKDVRSAVRAVRAALAEVQRQGGDWRSVIDGLRPHNNALWHSWDGVQRGRFVRHLRAWWDVHRHRAVGDVLAQIHEYLATHDVQRQAGFLEAVEPVADGLLARWRERGSATVHSRCFDVVLDATGKNPLRTPLVAQLLRDGLLSADRLRLGLCCDSQGVPLDPQGRHLHGLYLLGPLLQARDWESTAIPELRVQAAALAAQLGART